MTTISAWKSDAVIAFTPAVRFHCQSRHFAAQGDSPRTSNLSGAAYLMEIEYRGYFTMGGPNCGLTAFVLARFIQEGTQMFGTAGMP